MFFGPACTVQQARVSGAMRSWRGAVEGSDMAQVCPFIRSSTTAQEQRLRSDPGMTGYSFTPKCTSAATI